MPNKNDFDNPDEYWAWHKKNGYSSFINVNGTMTGLGSSIVRSAVREATLAAMGRFVKIHDLQSHASEVISRLTGADAGCITASASAGITLSVAGCMTGIDPARVEALPLDPGERSEVSVQLGHLCNYGAPISTAIELTGARVHPFGHSTLATDYQFDSTLSVQTVAALYVVSHHVVHYGQIPFAQFVEIAHAKNVPVIVDAASEYDVRGFIADGADIVIYSGHKFMGGPTAGIIAGRRDFVRAAYLQNIGIGRGMKIGKESIAGTIATMEQWMERDHVAIRKEETAALDLWKRALAGIPGVTVAIVSDPTGNPLERLQVNINSAEAGANAASFAGALGKRDPAIIVRDHEVELGYFQLDPCNLGPGQAELVADALANVLSNGSEIQPLAEDLAMERNSGVDSYLNWLSVKI